MPAWSSYFVSLISTGLSFFPSPVFVVITGNIVFWLSVHMVWAIIEWLYKKIPGVS